MFRTYPKQHVNSLCTVDFLGALSRDLRGPVIVVWDRGSMHQGEPIRELLRRFPRLQLEWLPPYAPELNPIEQLWNYLKYAKLATFTPDDVWELDHKPRQHLPPPSNGDQTDLNQFINAAHLPFLVDVQQIF